MLLHVHLGVTSGDLLGIKLKLTPEKLGWWGLEEENDWEFHTLADFREESWTVKLTVPEDGLMAVMGDEELTNAVLTMAARYSCEISHPAEGMFDQGRVIYRLADIIDPNQVSSVTILDQKFPAAE